MGSLYLKNLLNMTLTDEEMETIPQPELELYIHVTLKTIQAGAFLGMLVTGPVTTLLRGPRNLGSLWGRMTRHGFVGMLIGIPAGPAMTYGRMRKLPDGFYDRSYRIRRNRGQVRVDQISIVGGGVGAALGQANVLAGGLAGGLAAGVTVGVLTAAVLNSQLSAKKAHSQPAAKTDDSKPSAKMDDSKSSAKKE